MVQCPEGCRRGRWSWGSVSLPEELVRYQPGHESGDKSAYVPPLKAADRNYFKLPYSNWAQGYDLSLDQSEKLMLLIGLDQQHGFSLPS